MGIIQKCGFQAQLVPGAQTIFVIRTESLWISLSWVQFPLFWLYSQSVPHWQHQAQMLLSDPKRPNIFSPVISATAPGSMLTGLQWGVHWSTRKVRARGYIHGSKWLELWSSYTSHYVHFVHVHKLRVFVHSYTSHYGWGHIVLRTLGPTVGSHKWFIQVTREKDIVIRWWATSLWVGTTASDKGMTVSSGGNDSG